MSKKSNFNLDKALENLTKPSLFDVIIKQIDANEIPAEYIERISVFYHDGSVIDLSGDSITNPIPINSKAKWSDLDDAYKKMREVKVFIDIKKLERDVNKLMEELIGDHF